MLRLGQEETAKLLHILGYEVNRNFKFKARPERTASAIVNHYGIIHDFGASSFHGDIIDFLKEFHSMNFVDAKAYVEGRLGNLPMVEKYEWKDEKDTRPLPEHYLKEYLTAAKGKSRIFFSIELEKLFTGTVGGEKKPVCSLKRAMEIASLYQIGFVSGSHRLIMPVRNEKGQIMTFWKYRRDYDTSLDHAIEKKDFPKVLFSKNRVRPPFAITDLQKYKAEGKKIILTEGEKDTLVCLANGLNAVCVGGASAKLPIEYIHLFEGTDVILAGDYDDAGQFFNFRIASQLLGSNVKVTQSEFKANKKALFEELLRSHNSDKSVVAKVTVLDWEEKAAKDGFELFEKFDLADYFAYKFNK